METLFTYLEKVTGVNNLENRSWQDVVDNVILPMMAYPANQRNRIGNAFMKFMAEFTQDVCRKDEHHGEIMYQKAMDSNKVSMELLNLEVINRNRLGKFFHSTASTSAVPPLNSLS